MRARRMAWSACALAIAAATGLWLLWTSPAVEPSYELQRTIRYSFLVTNDTAEHIESASFRVFAPVRRNSYQETGQITANQPFETHTDESGNQSLQFTLNNLAPHASWVINITAEIRLASAPQPYDIGPETYLTAEPNIEVDAPELRELAARLAPDDNYVRRVTTWLHKNVADIGYVAEDRGARYAVTERKGDCTEFASAFVALARAGEIPSRMIGGFTVENSGKLRSENYHNWAEFRQGSGWALADAQNNIVDGGYGTYIAFHNFDRRSRLDNIHRFLSYDQRLSVQMQ